MEREHASTAVTLNSRAITAAVAVSVTLVLIKAYAWVTTGSLSLLTSLIDSSLDVLISLVNLMAVRYAAKPADDDHRFGHSAIEDIAGLAQAAFIGATGVFVLLEAMRRFLDPPTVQHADLGIGVIVVSLLLTLALVLYQRRVAEKTASLVVEADALHYLSDFLVNIAVILSLWLASDPAWALADPIIAAVIALYILSASWKIGTRAYHHLMDREVDDETRDAVITIIRQQEGVKDFHALKTRYSGTKLFVQCHLEIDGSLSLKDAHDISQEIEDTLAALYPDSEVLLHKDPI